VAIAREPLARLPDFVNFVIVPARFHAQGPCWVRLDLPKTSNHLIQVIRDHHDLTIDDADKLVGIGRLRIPPRFLVDLAGNFTIAIFRGVGACHGSSSKDLSAHSRFGGGAVLLTKKGRVDVGRPGTQAREHDGHLNLPGRVP
jgi:hypothetical protein